MCVCLLDFPERGAVSAVGGEAGPCAEHRCDDAAEIHPLMLCPKELCQVTAPHVSVWSSLQRIPGQVMFS